MMPERSLGLISASSSLLETLPDQPLPELYSRVMEKVSGYARGKLSDDATVLLMSVSDQPMDPDSAAIRQ